MRRKFVCGNWKMHKSIAEATALVRELRGAVSMVRDQVEIAVAPPFTAIASVAKALDGSNVAVAAQNVYWESQGAFTGEVSAPMLKEAGCTHAIVGHSERRQFFGETDEGVRKKAAALLKEKLLPIVCVGETLAERDGGRMLEVVSRQVRGALQGFTPAELGQITVAYEPVWAIGTGKTATTAQAQEAHAAIRKLLRELGGDVADAIRIQYGGSVKPDNAAELMSQPDVDGALVGGASLKVDDFSKIVKGSLQ